MRSRGLGRARRATWDSAPATTLVTVAPSWPSSSKTLLRQLLASRLVAGGVKILHTASEDRPDRYVGPTYGFGGVVVGEQLGSTTRWSRLRPEYGPLDRGWCLWVLTALAAVVAVAWAVRFASGHAPPDASATATRATAAPSPTRSPPCSLDFRDARFGEADWSVATIGPTTLATRPHAPGS